MKGSSATMSNLVKRAQKEIVSSDSLSGAAGKGLVAAGAIGGGLWFVAGLLPFISFPVLLVIVIVLGIALWE